ncbi:MAG: DUF86 domain-containing protein [Proteobacteria bacterium]|nr:DUF86 domain-containing protein [Pseudomonadota bacterium]
MSSDQQRLPDYLEHILETIDRIKRYTDGQDLQAFKINEMAQDAVIRNFEVIGEASNNIAKHYPEFAAAHPELPLAFAYRMRNAVAHGYFKVDVDIVWQTIHLDLPGLHAKIQAVRAPFADD